MLLGLFVQPIVINGKNEAGESRDRCFPLICFGFEEQNTEHST
jgi:hypothetical protein